MRAIYHAHKLGLEGLTYGEMPDLYPDLGEVLVKLKTAGLNHRDLFVLQRHQPTDPAIILGSDGAGIIEAVGKGVQGIQQGDEVIINPGLGWGKTSEAPPEGFEILGLPDHGTFAEQIVLPAQNVVPKPENLSWEEAGVLSLAALTAYRVLFTRARIQSGMKVLIPGIGSGVATFLLQFAKAAGATVYVTSRSEAKCQTALTLGAEQAINSNVDWNQALGGQKMDLVIESIGAATFNQSLGQLRPGGTMVTFGASAGNDVHMNIRDFFYGQFNLLGSTMGSAQEYSEMLEFIGTHHIKPVVDMTYPLKDFKQAIKRMESADQFGKIGFYIP